MIIIPDASVVVPLLLEEENSEACQELMEGAAARIHFDFTLIEVSNSLRSAVARGRISSKRANAAWAELVAICDSPIKASQYLEDAFTLALSINHSVYDCLYAVAARENRATFVTCDRKFAAKLAPLGYSIKVI